MTEPSKTIGQITSTKTEDLEMALARNSTMRDAVRKASPGTNAQRLDFLLAAASAKFVAAAEQAGTKIHSGEMTSLSIEQAMLSIMQDLTKRLAKEIFPTGQIELLGRLAKRALYVKEHLVEIKKINEMRNFLPANEWHGAYERAFHEAVLWMTDDLAHAGALPMRNHEALGLFADEKSLYCGTTEKANPPWVTNYDDPMERRQRAGDTFFAARGVRIQQAIQQFLFYLPGYGWCNQSWLRIYKVTPEGVDFAIVHPDAEITAAGHKVSNNGRLTEQQFSQTIMNPGFASKINNVYIPVKLPYHPSGGGGALRPIQWMNLRQYKPARLAEVNLVGFEDFNYLVSGEHWPRIDLSVATGSGAAGEFEVHTFQCFQARWTDDGDIIDFVGTEALHDLFAYRGVKELSKAPEEKKGDS